MAGGTPVTYRFDPESDYQPDITSLQKNVSPRTKLLIVNSPHNPTGSVLDSESIHDLAQFAVDQDLFVLSDEIYERITYGTQHIPLATAEGMSNRTITVSGFSKAYSMTGWRLGYLTAPSELLDPIVRIRQYTSTCSNSFAQHGGVRALEDSDELVAPLLGAFTDRRDALIRRIRAIPGMECPEPQGAFYAMPTIPEGISDETAFSKTLLRKGGVATVPGPVFSPRAEGRIRIAYATSIDRIHEAFDRLELLLEDQY
jgi:aspartate/methionine/tyrosine aminotransferase